MCIFRCDRKETVEILQGLLTARDAEIERLHKMVASLTDSRVHSQVFRKDVAPQPRASLVSTDGEINSIADFRGKTYEPTFTQAQLEAAFKGQQIGLETVEAS